MESKLIIYQDCLDKGWVERGDLFNLNLCSNPNCRSCREFEKTIDNIMKEELKNINEIEVELKEIEKYVNIL